MIPIRLWESPMETMLPQQRLTPGSYEGRVNRSINRVVCLLLLFVMIDRLGVWYCGDRYLMMLMLKGEKKYVDGHRQSHWKDDRDPHRAQHHTGLVYLRNTRVLSFGIRYVLSVLFFSSVRRNVSSSSWRKTMEKKTIRKHHTQSTWCCSIPPLRTLLVASLPSLTSTETGASFVIEVRWLNDVISFSPFFVSNLSSTSACRLSYRRAGREVWLFGSRVPSHQRSAPNGNSGLL